MKFQRILVILGLLIAVGAVFALKQRAPKASAPVAESSVALPRLIELGADKCIPCKAMAPILDNLRKTYAGQLQVDFIDVWKDPDAAKPFGIDLIPTQIFLDATGQERFRHEGFFSKEDILAKWAELGVSLQPNEAR